MVGKAHSDAAGNFSVETALPRDGSADGLHTVQVVARDAAGNSVMRQVSFTLDTQAPESVTITPTDGEHDVFPRQMIVATFDEPVMIGTMNGTFVPDLTDSLNGTFAAPMSIAVPVTGPNAGSQRTQLDTADFNNDNQLDLLVVGFFGAHPALVLLGNGDGTFTTSMIAN